METHSKLPKPRHSPLLFAAVFFFFLVFFIAAHESGSGFVQIIGAVLFAMFLTNALISFFRVKYANITIASVPFDATTDQSIDIAVIGTKNVFVALSDDKARSVFVPKDIKTVFSLKPPYCGLYQEIELVLSSSYPFGLITLQKKIVCNFPNKLYVAPLPTKTRELDTEIENFVKEVGLVQHNSNSGNLKSIIDYQPGDPISAISWSKTAQMQQLFTKVHEEQKSGANYQIEIHVPDRSDLNVAERYLGERLYLAISLMERGLSVTARIYQSDSYRDLQIENKLQIRRLIASLVS